MTPEFADATLVLIGHGSTLNAESAEPTYFHADILRRRGVFAEVISGFWKEHPTVAGVLRGALTPRVFIVPLFISDGYFTEQVIPRELGFCRNGQTDFPRVQDRNGQRLHYCGPVGTHSSMTQVILARAREIVERHPGAPGAPPPADSETALFIAGHGTSNNENSRKAIEQQAALIAAMGRYAETHSVFMEESPKIGDCYAMAKAPNVVMVPFFISDGLHSHEDIPVMLGEAESEVQTRLKSGCPTFPSPVTRRGKRVWYSQGIGTEPLLADVILERVREMATPA
jgi:sirohydrochlorin cobaltochelatase